MKPYIAITALFIAVAMASPAFTTAPKDTTAAAAEVTATLEDITFGIAAADCDKCQRDWVACMGVSLKPASARYWIVALSSC